MFTLFFGEFWGEGGSQAIHIFHPGGLVTHGCGLGSESQHVGDDGCSTDGTSEFLDGLARSSEHGDRIVVHRSPDLSATETSAWAAYLRSVARIRGNASSWSTPRCLWTDKLAMFNTAAQSISTESVLFQVPDRGGGVRTRLWE